jgi:hypothetical protein
MNLASSLGPRWRSLRAGAGAALRWRGGEGTGVALGTWLALALGLGLLTWLLAPVLPVLQIVPPFLAAAALWPAWQAAAARPGAHRWGARLEWPLLLLVLGMVAYHIFELPLIEAHKPIDSADHQMLLLRVQLIGDALAHGRWDRWTHLLQGGDSVTDLYPFLFDLLVTLIHKALPFPLRATYTVIVVLLLIGRSAAVFYLCRRFAGPLLSGAIAVSVLCDSGVDIWDGGTHSAVFWGLMHSQLSLTLAVVALRLSGDLLDQVSGPRLWACALVTALAAVAHPIGVFFMAVWLVSLAVATLFRATEARPPLWTGAAVALGLALAAVLVVPEVRALGQHGFSAAFPGLDYRAAGSLLVRGLQPSSGFGFAIGLGLLAIGAAATGRQLYLLAAAIASLLLFAYLLAPLSVQVRLFDFLPSLAEGQPRRNTGLLKLTALPAIAWLVSLAFAHLPKVGSLAPRAVVGRGVVLALLLLGPGRALWVGADEQSHGINRAFDRPPELVFGTRVAPDEQAVFDWVAAQRKQDPGPTLWRVALNWPRRWRHTLWASGLRTGVPLVDFGWVSGNFLAYRPREFSVAGMRDWAVRYVLTEDPATPMPGATQVFQSGGIWVWQVPGYDGQSVVAPPGVQIQGLRFEPDRIRFVVAGAPPAGAPLRIRTAWFPAWRARQAGKSIPVTAQLPRPDAKPRQEQLAIVAGNGEVVLACEGVMPGRLPGALISLAAAAALLFSRTAGRRARVEAAIGRGLTALGRRWQQTRSRAGQLPARRRRLVLGAAAVVILGGALIARLAGTTRLRPSPWELSGLSIRSRYAGETVPCLPTYWLGRSRCARLGEVDFFVGADARRDDTGEYVALFPGLRLSALEPGAEFLLRWDRARLAGRTLQLRFSTVGAFHVHLSAGGVPILDQQWTGSGKPSVALPPGLPRTGPVVLRATSIGRSSLVFDATLDPPAPRQP